MVSLRAVLVKSLQIQIDFFGGEYISTGVLPRTGKKFHGAKDKEFVAGDDCLFSNTVLEQYMYMENMSAVRHSWKFHESK